MSTIEIGKKAPAFSGNDQNGVKRTLKEFAGKKLVLYFYQKMIPQDARLKLVT